MTYEVRDAAWTLAQKRGWEVAEICESCGRVLIVVPWLETEAFAEKIARLLREDRKNRKKVEK